MSDAVMTITANDIAGIIESRAEVEDGYLGNAGYIAHEIYLTMLAASPSVGGWEDIRQHDFDRQAMTIIAAHLRDNPAEPYSGRQCEELVLDARDRLYPAAPPPVSTGSRPQEAVPTETEAGCWSSLDEATLQRLGKEVTEATNVRAFGLYDYSSYPAFEGGLKPHVVRDELARGKVVFQSDDASEARAEYVRLCHVFIGRRAVEIATTANSVGMSEANAPIPPVKTGEG